MNARGQSLLTLGARLGGLAVAAFLILGPLASLAVWSLAERWLWVVTGQQTPHGPSAAEAHPFPDSANSSVLTISRAPATIAIHHTAIRPAGCKGRIAGPA